jgi:hypothetical protein
MVFSRWDVLTLTQGVGVLSHGNNCGGGGCHMVFSGGGGITRCASNECLWAGRQPLQMGRQPSPSSSCFPLLDIPLECSFIINSEQVCVHTII